MWGTGSQVRMRSSIQDQRTCFSYMKERMGCRGLRKHYNGYCTTEEYINLKSTF